MHFSSLLSAVFSSCSVVPYRSSRVLATLSRMAFEKKPDVVFVLGGPGAGKGTQSQNIVKAMLKHATGKYLVDGFPRNEDNLMGWNRQMGDKVNLKFVLFFECPLEVLKQRCLDRGKAGSGRSDDNEDSLRKRFDTYMNSTMPIIQYYEAENLVRRVDATGTPEEVFEEVKKLFNES